MDAIDPHRLLRHLRILTEDIGVRLAGSEGERRAIDYIAEQFTRAGARVTTEPFPVNCRDVSEQRLDVRFDGSWEVFPCSLFSSTPGTDGRPIEAPLVFFESPTEYARADLSHLRGKAVVHLGCHVESRQSYRRLMEARPAFLMFVDTRYPGDVPLADGLFPAYTSSMGAVPTVNVAYQHGWDMKVRGATAARLTVIGGMRPSTSANVIAEVPGDEDRWLLLGAHHDTQADSVGADDNGSAVVALLELARVLAQCPRRRGLRFISFGAEEQLSVGSAQYVRQYRHALRQQALMMFNMDSFGSHLGWYEMIGSGPPSELVDALVTYFAASGIFVRYSDQCNPYADHFPFAAAGVPAVTLLRHNCTAGRFFHHRPDDTIARVDPAAMAKLLDALTDFVSQAAETDPWPYPSATEVEQDGRVNTYWDELFGGWVQTPDVTAHQGPPLEH